MAFIWWAILLFGKNEEVFSVRKENIELKRKLNGDLPILSENEMAAFDQINDRYHRQRLMIYGEASVFCLTLIIGLWLIYRAHNKEMQAANQQKNFLLSITHELKSPITSIKLALETFLNRNLNDSQVKSLSKGALAESNRLDLLVNDLLLSAKIEDGYKPEIESFNMSELLRGIIQNFEKSHADVELITSFEEKNLVSADAQGMNIILSNLMENAAKYNFSERKMIQISMSQNDKWLHLEVADNGSGIQESEQKNIFKKFYRLGEEHTRKTKGTGLGLYIVHEIVKSHGGSIEIKSNQPKGTRFLLALPIIASKSA